MDHRGRFQAQGGGIEKSESWGREHPLPVAEGRRMLQGLKSRLSAPEQHFRERAFEQADDFIGRASIAGGVMAPMKKSYPTPPRPDRRRVDIEVLKGLAFVMVHADRERTDAHD